MRATALPGHTRERGRDRVDETGMRVRADRAHAGEAARDQTADEREPGGPVLGGDDVEAERFAECVPVDADGVHDADVDRAATLPALHQLTPVRPGDRVKTDRRDAKKLVRLYRAGELSFVCPPTPEQEGLRDLVRCREDLRRARTAARHRLSKQLLRRGLIYREGRQAWTKRYQAWLRRQRLGDPLAQQAFEHMLCHLDAVDAQLAALDRQLEEVAASAPWCDPVRWLSCFRGVSTLTALGLLAEIGDFRRFGSARELMSFLGLTVSEYSSGERRQRGSITKTGNGHAP